MVQGGLTLRDRQGTQLVLKNINYHFLFLIRRVVYLFLLVDRRSQVGLVDQGGQGLLCRRFQHRFLYHQARQVFLFAQVGLLVLKR